MCNFQDGKRVDSRILKKAVLVWAKLLCGKYTSESAFQQQQPGTNNVDYLGKMERNTEIALDSEPTDFKRLPSTESFLRAVFDILVDLVASPGNFNLAKACMCSLHFKQ
jgi:hypothetical protein